MSVAIYSSDEDEYGRIKSSRKPIPKDSTMTTDFRGRPIKITASNVNMAELAPNNTRLVRLPKNEATDLL